MKGLFRKDYEAIPFLIAFSGDSAKASDGAFSFAAQSRFVFATRLAGYQLADSYTAQSLAHTQPTRQDSAMYKRLRPCRLGHHLATLNNLAQLNAIGDLHVFRKIIVFIRGKGFNLRQFGFG